MRASVVFVYTSYKVNSLRSRDTMWHHKTWSTLVRVRVCRLIRTKQLPKYLKQCCVIFFIEPLGSHPWWRHQTETFSALLAICAGNSPVPGEFTTQRRSFDVFFDLRLNRRLSKESKGWRLETLSRPLWRHRNVSETFQPNGNFLLKKVQWKIYYEKCQIFNSGVNSV